MCEEGAGAPASRWWRCIACNGTMHVMHIYIRNMRRHAGGATSIDITALSGARPSAAGVHATTNRRAQQLAEQQLTHAPATPAGRGLLLEGNTVTAV